MTLHLQELTVSSSTRALVDVADIHLHPGRPVTIVGESGSGKSLLAHALMGTLAAELAVAGRLTLDGARHDLADRRGRRKLWGRVLALLPQEPVLALDPTMRVGPQVAEGAPDWLEDKAGAYTQAATLLGALGLGQELTAYPHTLSGGMAQRVAFAAATIGGASVLIADEPSKGLDEHARIDLEKLLRRHVEHGGLLLTITHDLDLARTLGGDLLVMRDANIVERGPAERVLAEAEHDYTKRLLAAEPVRWRHRWMRDGATTAGRPLVTGHRLSKTLGGKALFSDLDIAVHAGERLALSGPSGSGKTTLGNVLLHLIRPDRGIVEHDLSLAGGRMQKLYQDPTLAFPAHVPISSALEDVLRRHKRERARLDGLLAALRLDRGLLARRPGQVSGGELQRLAIARAAVLEPKLLFADEPTSRLDLLTQEDTVCCLLDELQRNDCALVLVTHDRQLADAVGDRNIGLGNGGHRSVGCRLGQSPSSQVLR